MDVPDSQAVAETRAGNSYALASFSGEETDRFESWCREFFQAALFHYVEQVCSRLYSQARADAEARLLEYDQTPLAESIEAEQAAASQVHGRIKAGLDSQMEDLNDVVTRLERHPTIPDLQRLLDLAPPPQEALEPEPPQPAETLRQANERTLRDWTRARRDALDHHTRESVPSFNRMRDHLMVSTIYEFLHGAEQAYQRHHNLPPVGVEAEQQNVVQARTQIEHQYDQAKTRLTYVVDELNAWENEVGLINLALIAGALRSHWNPTDDEQGKLALIGDVLTQLRSG
ncbi:hypothetical protein C8250_029070 [Streptomyces sp. So13.3]|uniref:hypothetical protein n=1 Tax=Streptomyces sp. So13.3 TaxID=2136173 RepID=UPI0011070325|nr:hypothetical protein [Streptomyces sp. So13.3]QNA75403.1 hypothetical protein C8250_029070 [Streptomyces sp. So13.3]